VVATTITLTDVEMRIATAVARRVTSIQRGLIDFDDIRSEMFLWMCANPERVDRWREEGKVGKGKLNTALYRAGMRWAVKERCKQTSTMAQDHFFYSEAMLVDVLPDVFDEESWTFGSSTDEASGRSQSRPDEGNNRLAILVDVSNGVRALPEADRELLHDRFDHGGMDMQVLAAMYQVSDSTMRRRLRNVLRKLADNLGGEKPWV